MKCYETALLAIIISLAACKKSSTYTEPPPPWKIDITDVNKSYSFTGNGYRLLNNGEPFYFDAAANISALPNGVPFLFAAQTEFSTYKAGGIGLRVVLLDYNQPFLTSMNPANSTDARYTALLQRLLTKKYILNSTTEEFRVTFTDENGISWIADFNLPNNIDITDVVPYQHPGYSRCLKASIKFNLNMMADIASPVRKSISGTMAGFFALDK
jgi:hypothetical protein